MLPVTNQTFLVQEVPCRSSSRVVSDSRKTAGAHTVEVEKVHSCCQPP